MTPKEKAEELLNKFLDVEDSKGRSIIYFRLDARDCALIAIDDIIEEVREFCDDNFINDRLHYWEAVKQELDNL